MPRTTRLTDLQLILLATACQRADGSLLPPPERLGDQAARIRKAIPPLLKRSLVEEVGVSDQTRGWREEGDTLRGLAITEAGRVLIAAEEAESPAPPIASVAPATKIATVIEMLRREDGATLQELVTATGWLPHSTRAALTGLRKKGYAIDRITRAGVTVYAIAVA